jgi:hypothetical protein
MLDGVVVGGVFGQVDEVMLLHDGDPAGDNVR